MKKEYISLSELTREIMIEKNPEIKNKEEFINNGVKDYSKRMSEYLNDIYGDRFRYKSDKGKYYYKIPIAQKEIVKMTLKEYTSKYYKAVRNGTIPKVDFLQDYKEKAEIAIENSDGLSQNDKRMQLAEFLAITEYNSKVSANDIAENINTLVSNNLGSVKVKKDKKNRLLLNDYDAKLLILYYEKIIKAQTEKWNQLVDIVSELRFEDIAEDAENNNYDMGNTYNERAKSSYKLLEKAIKIFNDDFVKEDEYKNNISNDTQKKLDELFSNKKSSKK